MSLTTKRLRDDLHRDLLPLTRSQIDRISPIVKHTVQHLKSAGVAGISI